MFKQSKSCVSSSAADPLAILKKYVISDFDSLAQPSAIFDGIETTERRIWSDKAYSSSFGKSFTTTYTFLASSIDFCQTIKS